MIVGARLGKSVKWRNRESGRAEGRAQAGRASKIASFPSTSLLIACRTRLNLIRIQAGRHSRALVRSVGLPSPAQRRPGQPRAAPPGLGRSCESGTGRVAADGERARRQSGPLLSGASANNRRGEARRRRRRPKMRERANSAASSSKSDLFLACGGGVCELFALACCCWALAGSRSLSQSFWQRTSAHKKR